MIKIEHPVFPSKYQMEFIIEGMRNPMNSWSNSDSGICMETLSCHSCHENRNNCNKNQKIGFVLGSNDNSLMLRLAKAGKDHRKYLRMMQVGLRITAPLYWWKEFDTYKVGVVANSCSTMHKIAAKEFTLEDFSTEHLKDSWGECHDCFSPLDILYDVITMLNICREDYLKSKSKDDWWQMIQLLPSSYNQTRNVMMNYEVLANIYKSRKNHKLDEWRKLCKWIERLPYSEIITGDLSDKKRKDLVDVCRCKNCEYYISSEDMKENDMYKDYENTLGYNGFCMNVDKWADEDDFCSYGKTKGSDD
ncbi:hypothetical protein [Anaerostipes faecalis]|uniref:hypothetical protein n=1 Tax=Anaerostipes faecalis TaxID=2738446 RepID=UPI003F10F7CD